VRGTKYEVGSRLRGKDKECRKDNYRCALGFPQGSPKVIPERDEVRNTRYEVGSRLRGKDKECRKDNEC